MTPHLDRRRFLASAAAAGLGVLTTGGSLGADAADNFSDVQQPPAVPPGEEQLGLRPDYPSDRPNVILVRFGGGVRRRETILDPPRTWCPFIYHELARHRGILFNNVEIAADPGVETSHGQGTLYLLTGKFHHYRDVELFGDRFEPVAPTLFEYLRRKWNVAEHQALIINGEDRINEEFYTFSNHHLFGVRYRSTVLSLYRYKTFLLRERVTAGGRNEVEQRRLERELQAMETRDYRVANRNSATVTSPELDRFWRKWRDHYGTTGLVNPRGDRLLTTLALWSLRELRPRLMMINYNDPDYVHWGNPSFYTRAISIIDEGVRELYNACQADEEYRDRTVFVIVPDCGRDDNRCMMVPFQHHFNSQSSREIFAVIAGPRRFVPHAGRICDRRVMQTSVARAVGDLMDFQAPHADTPSLLGVV